MVTTHAEESFSSQKFGSIFCLQASDEKNYGKIKSRYYLDGPGGTY